MSTTTRRVARIAGIGLAVVLLLAASAVVVGLLLAERTLHRRVVLPDGVVPFASTADATVLERGRYLYATRGCVDCHGRDGAGRVFVDAPNGLRLAGPHIGPGSVTERYGPADWERAIRHGVSPQGHALFAMPSADYNRLTDADLAALVAHARSLPAVAGTPREVRLPTVVKVLYGFSVIRDAAAKIDHALPPAVPVPAGVSAAHGAYVANMCVGCHGAALHGGKVPGGPPDWPPAPRLAPGDGSALTSYPGADDLLRLFRTGTRADGSAVQVMPFESLREMSETDVRALHLYLRGLGS